MFIKGEFVMSKRAVLFGLIFMGILLGASIFMPAQTKAKLPTQANSKTPAMISLEKMSETNGESTDAEIQEQRAI